MANELGKSEVGPSALPVQQGGDLDKEAYDDPKSLYGLLWRIVRIATGSNVVLVRMLILLVFLAILTAVVGGAWLVVVLVR